MRRDLALERAWRKRMQKYERSGLTIRQFCEQEGLVSHQFSWWRSELKRRDANSTPLDRQASHKKSTKRTRSGHKSKDGSAGRFVPVQIKPSPRLEGSIEIILDRPLRLQVSCGFDAELLREVVRVLEQR